MAGFLSRLAPASETITISCYHCATIQPVGRKAMTVTCRQCHKPLQVSDVQVKRYDARREVKTVGTVVVEKNGQIVADQVVCGGLVARGQIKAKTTTTVRGTALVGPKADLSGNVEAFTLSVAEGAQLAGYYCVGKDHMVAPAPVIEPEAFPDAGAVDAPQATPAAATEVKPAVKPVAKPVAKPVLSTPARSAAPPPARPYPPPIRNGAELLRPRGFSSTSGGRTRG